MNRAPDTLSTFLRKLVGDLTAMASTKFRVDEPEMRVVALSYAVALAWLGKVLGTLWLLGIACWTLNNLWNEDEWLAASLGGFFVVGLTISLNLGNRSRTWLTVAARLGASALLIELAFLLLGHRKLILPVNFVLLVGLPSATSLVALIPAGEALEVFRLGRPELCGVIARMAKFTFLGILWTAFYAVSFHFFAAGKQPLAPLVMAPMFLATAVLIGLGMIRMNPDKFLGWPAKLVSILTTLGLSVAVTMPHSVARASRILKSLDSRFVEPIEAIAFDPSATLAFLDISGHSQIWYAERTDGGLDLFYNRSGHSTTPDARPLHLADTEESRQRIRDWMEQQVAARSAEADRKAQEAAQQQAERERALAEAAQRDEDGRREQAARVVEEAKESNRTRIASYVTNRPTERVDYVVLVRDHRGQRSSEAMAAIISRLAAARLVAGDIFSDSFLTDGEYDLFVAGKGTEDLKAMALSETVRFILLIRIDNERLVPSKEVAGVQSCSMSTIATLLSASDGSKRGEWVMNTVVGAGVTEPAARSTFFDKYAEALVLKLPR